MLFFESGRSSKKVSMKKGYQKWIERRQVVSREMYKHNLQNTVDNF